MVLSEIFRHVITSSLVTGETQAPDTDQPVRFLQVFNNLPKEAELRASGLMVSVKLHISPASRTM
jgi:hypothetical protein